MIKRIQYSLKESDRDPLRLIESYFTEQGFNLEEKMKNGLWFTRGSILLNMFTFNPLKWKSKVQVEIKEQTVSVVVDIDTTFQAVLSSEEGVWDSFLENLGQSLDSGVVPIQENKKVLNEGKRQSFRVVGYMVAGAIIAGTLGGFITFVIGLESDVLIRWGAIGGAIAAIAYKGDRFR